MSVSHRTRGVKVLKAVSSSLRLQILNFLFDRNALSYTELMSALKMNPSRDAGRFAYHLKFLLKANLVDADVETKKYYLTDLGKMLIDIADRVEKNAQKPKTLLVHTSHSTLEEFDANKIAHSLIKEAKMPAEEAQKIAKEAEKLIQKSKTKFVTSPLIREIVNTLLIEKGQEDYRHKLTRLGLPVHEVTALLENKDTPQSSSTILAKAGQTIFSEYTLLNVLPRDIADAHTTGAIHLNSLSTWLLKPKEIIHDIRFFLQNGLNTNNPLQLPQRPPETLEQALTLILNVLLHSSQEVSELQTLAEFNNFLAPYAKGTHLNSTKEALRSFVQNLNHQVDTAISLNLTIPQSIADKPAVGLGGKTAGKYADYSQESRQIASQLLEIVAQESNLKPMLNPRIIIKISKATFTDEEARQILEAAHGFAAEKGILCFAIASEERNTSFSATGAKFEPDLTGDWETDTLRTGCSGMVTINLPRIVREIEKEKDKFFDLLKERFELATRALEIKTRTLKQREKMILPFLTQSGGGDKYFRLENCSNLINFAGSLEAAEAFCQLEGNARDIPEFIKELAQNILGLKTKTGRKHGKRFFPVILQSQEASERLAQLDLEKYGVAKVQFLGTRDKPYYSTVKRLQILTGPPIAVKSDSLERNQAFGILSAGGNLSVVELEKAEIKPDELLSLTKQIMESQVVEFFTYNRQMTFCSNCEKTYLGILQKCPQCGSISTITIYDLFAKS
jgi:anaerobic ribonucleoside-triphosphate reductase